MNAQAVSGSRPEGVFEKSGNQFKAGIRMVQALGIETDFVFW
jgi:hypothetical protein